MPLATTASRSGLDKTVPDKTVPVSRAPLHDLAPAALLVAKA